MRWRATPPPVEVTAHVVLDPRVGLTVKPAQRVRARAVEHDCEILIETDAGRVADAKILFQLLLLGVAAGEPLTVRCRGSGAQAQAACDAIINVLVAAD